jgi:stearoyl-CoA desaturase (delta-9 desaturase)
VTKKFISWSALGVMFAAYIAVIYYYPRAFLWSMIPTWAIATPTTTIYLHRAKNHRAMKMAKWLMGLFEIAQWTTIGSKTKEWVAEHRKHHTNSDNQDDPHSPLWVVDSDGSTRRANGIEGLIPQVLPFNVVRYRHWLRRHAEEIPVLARDVIADEPASVKWMNRHVMLGLALGTTLLCLFAGLKIGLLAAGLHLVSFVFILNPLINGLCHYPHRWLLGYQNTRLDDTVTTWNNWCVAFITWGEGLHDNHHLGQTRAMLARRWWELLADAGTWAIIVFWLLGAVWNVKLTEKTTLPRIDIFLRQRFA